MRYKQDADLTINVDMTREVKRANTEPRELRWNQKLPPTSREVDAAVTRERMELMEVIRKSRENK